MVGKIKTIVQFKQYVRSIIIDVDGKNAKTYVDENNANSKRWERVQIGDCLDSLEWFDKERKIISADSKFVILKQ